QGQRLVRRPVQLAVQQRRRGQGRRGQGRRRQGRRRQGRRGQGRRGQGRGVVGGGLVRFVHLVGGLGLVERIQRIQRIQRRFRRAREERALVPVHLIVSSKLRAGATLAGMDERKRIEELRRQLLD